MNLADGLGNGENLAVIKFGKQENLADHPQYEWPDQVELYGHDTKLHDPPRRHLGWGAEQLRIGSLRLTERV